MRSTRRPDAATGIGVKDVSLDLTLLAAGTRQQAFVLTSGGRSSVYKVPATSGVRQQYGADLADYQPVGIATSALFTLAVRWPDRAWRRILANDAARERSGLLSVMHAGHARYVEARMRVFESAYRWTRERHFRRMLTVVDALARHGLDDLLISHRILRGATATQRLPGGPITYRGDILEQEWAEFYERSGGFDTFDWDSVITAQHRLWRRGFALSDVNEILGPKNWARVGRALHLADFSSLTQRYRTARRLLRADLLDARQERVLRRLRLEAPEQATLAEAYFRLVRREINEARLAELWRRDLVPAVSSRAIATKPVTPPAPAAR